MKAGENQALGIIETEGRAPLIEAVDSAIKAAAVTLKSSYFVGGGLNTVTLVGDVGAMRAALDAAKAVIDRMGAAGQTHLIPRLAQDVWPLVLDQTNGRLDQTAGRGPPRNPPGPDKPKGPEKKAAAALPLREASPPSGKPEAGTGAPAEEAPVREEAGMREEQPPAEAGGETLFPEELSRAGKKTSVPEKKSGGPSPRKKPSNRNPEPKG